MTSHRNASISIKRRTARYLTAGVFGLQLFFILTMIFDPAGEPIALPPFELLWAWMHQPSFYPFVAVLTFGPVLTIVAWRMRGPHRLLLIFSWLVVLVIVYVYFYERILLKMKILWWQYGG